MAKRWLQPASTAVKATAALYLPERGESPGEDANNFLRLRLV
jgi:hypothetical protein